MREIKFRVWNVKEKKLVYQDYYLIGDNDERALWSEIIFWETTQFIKQQFTGLKDKNGKEIYEGDIVEVEATRFEYDSFSQHDGKVILRAEVKYGRTYFSKDEVGFYLELKNDFNDRIKQPKGKEKLDREFVFYNGAGTITHKSVNVIGNISENSELIN